MWQLWSGHLMHFGATHALTDLLALCCAAVLVEADLGSRRTLLLYFGAAPLISLTTLLAAPHLVAYRGASALAVTLCFAAAERLWRDRHLRAPLLLIAAAFTAKLACDAWGLQTDLSGLPAGIAVAWQAHVAGAVIGLILALIPQVRRRAPNATA
nr:rhomboid family intramembrane serine protease [Niveibacterium umoris]